jgi:transcriptional regulator with XRE-family HTH domain
MPSNSDKWRDIRYTSSMIGRARSLGTQIKDLCQEQDITKQELADRLLGGAFAPSRLSHMIRRSDPIFIEEVAHELGVKPEFFDEYVVQKIETLVDLDSRLVAVLRGFLKADSATRERWFKSSEKVFNLSEYAP